MSGWDQTIEPFEDFVERHRVDRETKPTSCSHCQFETTELENHSRSYGGNVGGHWLCIFCRQTISASRVGAAGVAKRDQTVADVAAMFNVLVEYLQRNLP